MKIKKMALFLSAIIIIIALAIIILTHKKDSESSSKSPSENFNRIEIFNDNKDDFEIIRKYFINNPEVYSVSKKKVSNKYIKYRDYYISYDLNGFISNDNSKVEERDIGDPTQMMKSFVKIGLEQITCSYNIDTILEEYDTSQIYACRLYMDTSVDNTISYDLCIDKECKIKDSYDETKKYGKKMYSETNKINEYWGSTFSNIK